ncbi:MAG: cytochrome c biogenesis protein CcsA [Bacteroidetes bacterium]|nr:cytochrome c biogenesis protein CcsA [Bacteroidota bacterium]
MRKNWWKYLAVLLLLYVLAGGLFTPLKTGIGGTDRLKITSMDSQQVQIGIYNPGADFRVENVLISNGNLNFTSLNNHWDGKGMLKATFAPRLGKTGDGGGLFSLYVKANGYWMAYPAAFSIERNPADTVSSNALRPEQSNLSAGVPDAFRAFPNRQVLYESIRNLLFHVPMWFTMICLLLLSAWHATRYLMKQHIDADLRSESLARVAVLTGFLGCVTGSVWARVTWGLWWPSDPKLNGVAVGMLMYLAYLLLRSSLNDPYQRARVSAVYNVFVFPVFIALIVIMPKLSDASVHPGSGGTVGFNKYDLDNTLRMYFYPAVAGWILLFLWMSSLLYRFKKIQWQSETP